MPREGFNPLIFCFSRPLQYAEFTGDKDIPIPTLQGERFIFFIFVYQPNTFKQILTSFGESLNYFLIFLLQLFQWGEM